MQKPHPPPCVTPPQSTTPSVALTPLHKPTQNAHYPPLSKDVLVNHHKSAPGLLAAGAAFICWGLLPLYWKALSAVPSLEIICHRIAWSVVATGLLLLLLGRMGEVRKAMGSLRDMGMLAASSGLIGVN